jgi:hypothetical protein
MLERQNWHCSTNDETVERAVGEGRRRACVPSADAMRPGGGSGADLARFSMDLPVVLMSTL